MSDLSSLIKTLIARKNVLNATDHGNSEFALMFNGENEWWAAIGNRGNGVNIAEGQLAQADAVADTPEGAVQALIDLLPDA